jgi:hypothetical protein
LFARFPFAENHFGKTLPSGAGVVNPRVADVFIREIF